MLKKVLTSVLLISAIGAMSVILQKIFEEDNRKKLQKNIQRIKIPPVVIVKGRSIGAQ